MRNILAFIFEFLAILGVYGNTATVVLSGEKCMVNVLTQEDFRIEEITDKDTDNTHFIVKYDFDLKGETLRLPEKSVLDFQGGSIRNGTLVGNNSSLRSESRVIFYKILIMGTWKIPYIYTEWFAKERNSIREPFKLLNENFHNKLIVGKGVWEIEMPENEKYAISIPSNSEILVLGTIRNYTNLPGGFSIFHISESNNVKICGDGEIVGNRNDQSVAKRGSQTGHSISVGTSSNVVIEGITLSNSRGDGILVGEDGCLNMPENVIIRNIKILHSRRQGISICAGHNVVIENVYIEDVSGGPKGPCAGIDIENYDEGGVIDNVNIRNVMVSKASKGLLIYNDSDKAYSDKSISMSGRASLSRIYVTNYIATECEVGLRICYLSDNIQIDNCVFEATDIALSLYSDYSQEHDYSQQFCHQINNCKFISKQSGLKASVDVRTNGFSFNNCYFETSSPFTVHESAGKTMFRNCIFKANSRIRFFDASSLEGCTVYAPSLLFVKGGKAFDCTINSPVIIQDNNTLSNCDVYYHGSITNLISVDGDNNRICYNNLNCYDDTNNEKTTMKIENIINVKGNGCKVENNLIGLKNCKTGIKINAQDRKRILKDNLFY